MVRGGPSAAGAGGMSMPKTDTPVNRMPAPPPLEAGYYSLCSCCNGYGLLVNLDAPGVRPCHNCHTSGLVPHEETCDRSLVEWGGPE